MRTTNLPATRQSGKSCVSGPNIALFSVYTLFVGVVGRPDLGGQQHEMAGMLFDSLQRKQLTLPDHLEIFPGYQAGSNCGGGLSGKLSSTLGFEKRFNPLLAVKDKERFIRLITGRLPPRPAEMGQKYRHSFPAGFAKIPTPAKAVA